MYGVCQCSSKSNVILPVPSIDAKILPLPVPGFIILPLSWPFDETVYEPYARCSEPSGLLQILQEPFFSKNAYHTVESELDTSFHRPMKFFADSDVCELVVFVVAVDPDAEEPKRDCSSSCDSCSQPVKNTMAMIKTGITRNISRMLKFIGI